MHHDDLYDSVKTACLVLELNAKIISASQILGFLNFNMS